MIDELKTSILDKDMAEQCTGSTASLLSFDVEFLDWQRIDHDNDSLFSYSSASRDPLDKTSESLFSFEWITESSLDEDYLETVAAPTQMTETSSIVIEWERIPSRKGVNEILTTTGDIDILEHNGSSKDSSTAWRQPNKDKKRIAKWLLKKKFRFPSQRTSLGVDQTLVWIRNSKRDWDDLTKQYGGMLWWSLELIKHGGLSLVHEMARKWFERREERRCTGDFSIYENIFWVRHLTCVAISDGVHDELPMVSHDFFARIHIITQGEEPAHEDSGDNFLWIRKSPQYLMHAHSKFLELSKNSTECVDMAATNASCDTDQENQCSRSTRCSYRCSFSNEDYLERSNRQSIAIERLQFWTEGMEECDNRVCYKGDRDPPPPAQDSSLEHLLPDTPVDKADSFASMRSVDKEGLKTDKPTEDVSVMSFETVETHVSNLSDDHNHWDYEMI